MSASVGARVALARDEASGGGRGGNGQRGAHPQLVLHLGELRDNLVEMLALGNRLRRRRSAAQSAGGGRARQQRRDRWRQRAQKCVRSPPSPLR